MAKLSDASTGDVVVIDGTEYRLMIPLRGGHLCRIRRDGEHVWFGDDQEIEEIVWENPKRNKKARKDNRRGDVGHR